MTQASLVPCETQRIGPRTHRCSVPRTKGRVRADPPLESGLSTRNATLRQDRPWRPGWQEGGEQRGEVGEADDHTEGAPGHRVADTGDLLLEGVNDPERERGAQSHAEPDAEQGHERRLYKESQPYLSPLKAQGTEHPDLLPSFDHGAGCDDTEGCDAYQET